MVIQMLFNKKVQIIFLWTKFTFLKNYLFVYIIEGNLWIIYQFFHLDKLSIRYDLLYLKICAMFKWSMV